MPAIEDSYALVIGIANYQHINKLPPTVLKDAKDIHDLLVDPQHCGYPPDNVYLLLDEQATLAAMRAALADLAQRCNGGSTVFLYLSSHGGRIESGPHAGEYLLPVDVGADTSVSPSQLAAATAIAGDEFTAALRAIPARKVVVVFDCCHSGGVGQPKDGLGATFKVGLPESYYDALKGGQGRVILASSRSTEYSFVLPGDRNSLFTKHLLAGLQGGIASEDGLITIFDLFEYVQPRVTVDQPNQHPIFKAEIEENFAIALYLGGQKGAVPRDEQGFRYDVYVSYAEDSRQDVDWVWETMWPRLEEAGLRVAISDDVAEQGVARVVNMERGMTQSRRTVVVLSPRYLANRMAQFEGIMAQTLSIEEGAARMIPVIIEPLDLSLLPYRLNPHIVAPADLSEPGRRAERQFDKLISTLQDPLVSLF
jgi:hypothetical protein